MIEEGGNKRKTMAEKRQLFIEMREFPVLLGSLFLRAEYFLLLFKSALIRNFVTNFRDGRMGVKR